MRLCLLLLTALTLGACSSLPHDGPPGGAFGEETTSPSTHGYALLELNYKVTQEVAAIPIASFATLDSASSLAPNDRIGRGDALTVAVFETRGLSLSTTNETSAAGGANAPESLPREVVDENGAVMIPYAGEVRVAGLTTSEAARRIQAALKGRVVNPQVVVTMADNLANTVTVIGEVRSTGRVPLSANNERLLDVLATVGGPTRPPWDIAVTVVRGATSATAPLATVLHDPNQNIRLAPGDQVRLLYTPRKFSTFGAFGHVAEQPIDDETLSLAAAISRNGGLDTMSANAKSVLVFRFERPEVARSLGVTLAPTPKGVPIVYRLDLLEPEGFFIASNFTVQPNDLIYVPRSDTTELRKFLDLVSAVSAITYNLTVTPVLK
jgi:polysaccharide export outer membrane protein